MTQLELIHVDQQTDTRVAVVPQTSGNPFGQLIDPRDVPYQIDILDQWVEAASIWVCRETCRNKDGKSPETIKVHARSFIDFFTYQFPSKPVIPGLDSLARAIAAGDEVAALQMSRLIREIFTECVTQYRIASAMGQRSGIKPPWFIDITDVKRWAFDLERRTYYTTQLVRGPRKSKRNPDGGTKKVSKEEKLSKGSIAQRVAALSSFYIYVSKVHTILQPDGLQRPIYDLNPVAAMSRKDIYAFHDAIALNAEQIAALLVAIRSNHSITGLRDFALFSTYIYTGRRNSEIRELTWGDISDDGKQYKALTKGKKDHYEKADLPSPAYKAIVRYLKAAKRFETMQPGDFIFIAHSDRAKHLRSRSGQPIVNDTYAPGLHAISSREVGRVLKKYSRKAGLDESKIHVHVLRHSAAMLRKAVGDSVDAISKMLGHASLNTTMIYLDHMEGHKDVSWRKVEALIGLDDADPDTIAELERLEQEYVR